jgi:hypothetical protein
MKKQSRNIIWLGGWMVILMMISGCATNRMAPALFKTPPKEDPLGEARLIPIPDVITSTNVPLTIRIPKKEVVLLPENATMSTDVTIKKGSSVVISIPSSTALCKEAKKDNQVGFCTDEYFNLLEQYVERGLMLANLTVKDRAKFEAELRGIRTQSEPKTGNLTPYSSVLENLKKELEAGTLSRDEYAQQALAFRDRLPTLKKSKTTKELIDITELLRAAQDGEVQADYILQVNDLSIAPYSGNVLQLANRPEVKAFLLKNPGLKLGKETKKDMICATLKQSWAQAHFNAKLINVKTGEIDWIGDLTIDSLSVLEDGVFVYINVRKHPTNQNIIIASIKSHNNNVLAVYKRASTALQNLDKAYAEATKEFAYYGTPFKEDEVQAERKEKIKQLEALYKSSLEEYRNIARKEHSKLGTTLNYEYDIDAPILIPNVLQPKTKKEQQKLVGHIKKMGAEITKLLPKTIRISEN